MTMLVTLITPSYNKGRFLADTIESVINQTYQETEYIILDACSTDGTPSVLDRYRSHPRVSRIIVEKDSGQTDAINRGFRMARGEIVGWINADDILAPNAVESAVNVFRADYKISIAYGDIHVINEMGGGIRMIKAPLSLSRHSLLTLNYDVYQPGSFYRRSDVAEVGFLDEELRYCMDLDLWLKILGRASARHMGEVVASFRLAPGTKTVTGGIEFIAEIHKILRRHGAGFVCATERKLLWSGIKRLVRDWVIS